MAADVRVAIEDYEILLPAMNNQSAFIFGRIFTGCTKDTGEAGTFRTGGADVFVPPGTPEYFHELT